MQGDHDGGKVTLRELREKRGLTLEAVGYLADLDQATVSRIERGLVHPQRETVVRLARALGMSVARLGEILDESARRVPSGSRP